jgi:hypothetical protein
MALNPVHTRAEPRAMLTNAAVQGKRDAGIIKSVTHACSARGTNQSQSAPTCACKLTAYHAVYHAASAVYPAAPSFPAGAVRAATKVQHSMKRMSWHDRSTTLRCTAHALRLQKK